MKHECYYRNVLLDVKACIEGTQTNEVIGHFTKYRPIAEMAQIYAMVCSGLIEIKETPLDSSEA